MVIDVMDLNFKKLNFSTSYDGARYQRGKILYERKFARITDENTYLVEDVVRGSYNIYNIAMKIKDNIAHWGRHFWGETILFWQEAV